MRIIVVEDLSEKSREIVNHLEQLVEGARVEVAESWQQGLRKLKGENWDFMILDISMPQFAGDGVEGKFLHFAGKEILEELERVGKLLPFVVITAFDYIGRGVGRQSFMELKDDISSKYPQHCLDVVHWGDGWRTSLTAVLCEDQQ